MLFLKDDAHLWGIFLLERGWVWHIILQNGNATNEAALGTYGVCLGKSGGCVVIVSSINIQQYKNNCSHDQATFIPCHYNLLFIQVTLPLYMLSVSSWIHYLGFIRILLIRSSSGSSLGTKTLFNVPEICIGAWCFTSSEPLGVQEVYSYFGCLSRLLMLLVSA